jgi:hypothetical protein
MTWQKITVILAAIISLSTIGKVVYQFSAKVETAFAFIEKTDRRHTQEDLIFLEKREQALIDRRLEGHQTPGDIDEILRLRTQINELKRELGYLK